VCFYDIGLWSFYRVGTVSKLAAAYTKCIEIFCGYSVTSMLIELGYPSFSTVLFNAAFLQQFKHICYQFGSDGCLRFVWFLADRYIERKQT